MQRAIAHRFFIKKNLPTAVSTGNQNAQKTSLFSLLGHELRTPLNAILGFAEVLRDDENNTIPKDVRVEHAKTIVENAQKLQHLLAQILDASRVESGELSFVDQDCDLSEALEVIAKQSERDNSNQDVVIIARLISGVNVRGDVRRLSQAFAALLDNAIRFSPPDGIVNINMLRGAGGRLIISITDAGAGMAEDSIKQAHVPFTQGSTGLSRSHGGLGLGLYLAHSIAEHHHGELQFIVSPGVGTDARLSLPASRVTWPIRQPKIQVAA